MLSLDEFRYAECRGACSVNCHWSAVFCTKIFKENSTLMKKKIKTLLFQPFF
jgi:hypothetical protein